MVFDYCKTSILRTKPKTTYKDVAGRRNTKSKKAGLTPLESLFSGMAAGATSAVCTYPLDLARAQLAVLRGVKKKKSNLAVDTAVDGIKKKRKGLGYVWSKSIQQGVSTLNILIQSNENNKLTHELFLLHAKGLRGLYRGITPTLLGILPYSGIAFTINEQGKRQVSIHTYIEMFL